MSLWTLGNDNVAIDCCLTPNEQVFNYIMVRTGRNDKDVRFVLDQHT